MKLDIKTTTTVDVIYIEVSAGVRYWEDATVNPHGDDDGSLIPFRKGDRWCPVIRLADGLVMDWPAGTLASVHYKVCDDGDYWLLDADRRRVAKWSDDYVPDEFMCHDGDGFGDYIIMVIGPDGLVENWRAPSIDPDEWEAVK